MNITAQESTVVERPITVPEAAALLEQWTGEKWTIRRLYRLIEKGFCPARRVGFAIRLLASDLERWWRNGGTDPELLRALRAQRAEARRTLRVKPRRRRAAPVDA